MKIKNILTIVVSLALVAGIACSAAACTNGSDNKKPSGRTHDRETHVINGSSDNKTIHHNFVNGKCTMCDETTIFRQDAMSKSPEILLTEQSKRGTVEYFWYETRAYGVEEKLANGEMAKPAEYKDGDELWIKKRAYVYLPCGYNKEDTSKKYNVLYMMHGDKLNEGYWFRTGAYSDPGQHSAYTGGYGTENMLDYMYGNNLIEDTIFVAMTMYQYYNGEYSGDDANPNYVGGNDAQGNIYSGYKVPEKDLGYSTGVGIDNEGTDTVYWKEWRYHLMPYVVENFNTYAASASEEDLIAARDHVGFTGLSRGGASVCSVIDNCLKYISYFAYESNWYRVGDSQIKTIKDNANAYPVNYMFLSCGSQEDPEENDRVMLKIKNELGWNEGSDIKGGDKISFIQVNGTAHNYATWITNLYNLMLVFFKK